MRPRIQIRNRTLMITDMVLIVTSVLASFALRLELGAAFTGYLPSAWTMVGIALVVKPVIYYLFGLYRRYWVYASIRELRLIFFATTAASILVTLIVLVVRSLGGFQAGFPRSVLGIDWLLSLFSVGGLRLSVRLLSEAGQVNQKADGSKQGRRVVVVGAGDAGALVVREMQRNPQLNMQPVAFVDDDPEKQKMVIHGVRVAGMLKDLAEVVRRMVAEEVVIAIPTAPGSVVRQVTEICRRYNIPFKTIPGVYELIGGNVNVSRLREVDITDLLRREPAHVDDAGVAEILTGKKVLVTGAGGSIGLELCRQIARFEPDQLVLLGHGENSIFEGLIELKADFEGLLITPVIADVRDRDRLWNVFEEIHPEVVFHAAAHKHVPLMEINVEEAVTNNILGTQNVVDVAAANGTERLVLISTDKAVQPTSIMGATKRIAELLVQDRATQTHRIFVSVRFGNVLGSRGSIVPIFRKQIARGGPVTVTHPEMKRFFMTIPEAVHLVLKAASMGEGGEVYVLKMGEQISILELAEDMIRLSGFEPGEDIQIVFTGVRPGEKLSEALWDEGIDFEPTEHPDIVAVVEEGVLRGEELENAVKELLRLAREGDDAHILGLLNERLQGDLLEPSTPPDFTSVI